MVRVVIVEGTAEEVIAVTNQLASAPAPAIATAVAPPPAADEEPSEGWNYVSEELATKVLSRRRLGDEQKIVLSTLAKAYPNFVGATDLQKATGYTPAQFAGLMGAFGRRMT